MSFMSTTAPPDFSAAMKAAETLGVSEYDFFRLAFRRWSGREADEKALERYFVAYMFHQDVPVWVRHFSRDVLSRDAAGKLDAAELGALKYRHHPPPHRNGPLYIGLMGAMMVLYCVALLDISYDPQTSAPMTCYGGPGFKVIAGMAYAVSGKEPTNCENFNNPR
ncbi:MAG: hypothetical protein IH994_01560 [Proteobacteria bacterium]|nr:hypothetical protein [Pseudomonadota bacterium]